MSKEAQKLIPLLRSYRKNHPKALIEALATLLVEDLQREAEKEK
jgi:hypothetical protein